MQWKGQEVSGQKEWCVALAVIVLLDSMCGGDGNGGEWIRFIHMESQLTDFQLSLESPADEKNTDAQVSLQKRQHLRAQSGTEICKISLGRI